MRIRSSLPLALTATIAIAATTDCGPEEKPYKPKAAYSGKKPDIPQPPTLPNKSKKDGDAYNVWGAIHDIHSYVHGDSFKGKDVAITGYIVQINFAVGCKDEMKRDVGEHCVPKCAVFAGGEKDTPPGCEAPIPTFWIAESKDEKDFKKKAIPVLNWASNWSTIYDAIKEFDGDEEVEMLDKLSNVVIPNPLPNVGAKVKVTGRYGFTANVGTKGASSNPRTGILTYKSLTYVEKPAEAAKLPYMD